METEKAGTPQETGQSSQKLSETISKAEHQAALNKLSNQLAENGRVIASLTSERDSLKTASARLAEAEAALEARELELDEQGKDDPDRQATLKARRDAEAKLKVAQAKETEADKKFSEREVRALKMERDDLIGEISDSYITPDGEETNPGDLIRAAERLGINKPDRETLVAIAEEKGWKLKTEPSGDGEVSAPLVSGKTFGGRESLEGKSTDELFRMAYSTEKK